MLSALKMALGTLGSRVLGLVRDVLLASSFSPLVTDAWLVAFRIPNLFRRLFGEGALSVGFMPLLVEAREREGETAQRAFIDEVFSFLFLLLGFFSLACFVFAPEILQILAGGEAFSAVAGKMQATVRFLRIMSFFLLFICIFAFLMALLNSREKFFAAALAPALLNLSLIAACFLPSSWWELPGEWLAWMALLGGFLQMAILLPAVYRLGLLPRFRWDFFSPRLRQLFKNTMPAFFSMGVLQITTMVNVYFASDLENGANTWIYLADRLLELPLSLVAVSFSAALLPRLSQQWAQQQLAEFSSEFQRQLQAALFLAIPAAVGLFLLAHPLVEMIFQRGEFNAYAAAKTASVVEVYAISLVLYSVIRLLNVCFYAAKKVWLPTLGTLVGLVVHLSLLPYFSQRFGVVGLAMSTTLSGLINLFCQSILFSKFFGHFSLRRLLRSLASVSFASGLMAALLLLYLRFVETQALRSIPPTLSLLLAIVLAAGFYFLVAYFSGAEEFLALKRRWRAKTGSPS